VHRFIFPLSLCLLTLHPAHATDFRQLSADFEQSFDVQPLPPTLSGRIAFSAKIQGFDRILVLDLDAKKIRRAVDGPGNNTYPNFSPDGAKLTFTSDRDGKKAIYISDWDGDNPQRLTTSKDPEENPSWSADGKFITYNSETGSGDSSTSNIFMVDVGTKKVTQVTHLSGKNSLPKFTADGKSITYNTNRFWPGWDICTWNIAGGYEKCPLGGNVSYCRPAWSHAGKLLAVSEGTGDHVDISVLADDQKVPDQLSDHEGKEYDASWSPDDSHILYVSESAATKEFNLFIADRDTKKSQPLILATLPMRYPSWSKVKTLELEAKRIVNAEGIVPPVPLRKDSVSSVTPTPLVPPIVTLASATFTPAATLTPDESSTGTIAAPTATEAPSATPSAVTPFIAATSTVAATPSLSVTP
jgi:hypothetical protein